MMHLYANIHVLSKNDSGYFKKYINIYISFISSHKHTFLKTSKNNSGYLKKMKFKILSHMHTSHMCTNDLRKKIVPWRL